MATILENLTRVLNELKIQGVEPSDLSRPDRVFAFDRKRELLVHMLRYRGEHWHEDARGFELQKFHGRSAIASFREVSSPSMQVVVHAISDASPSREDCYFVELDIDHQAPINPMKLLVHGEEVLVNAFTHATTDQDDIERRLVARLGPLTNA